jgi:hypothetical protein
MLRVAHVGVLCGCGLMLAWPAAAQQQDNSAPPQQKQSDSSPKKDQKKPSTGGQNAFPQAQSEKAAQQGQRGQSEDAPAAPAPQSEPKSRSTAAQNPFPEAESEKAARQDHDQQDQGNSPPTGSPSHNGDYSSSQVKGMDLPKGTGATTAPQSAPIYSPKLAKKDVQVGMFYLQTGDFKGAYDRFAEATHSDPGNAEAVYGLAASAQRIGKRDEALRNYQLYLSAVPDGPHAKDVRKAMKEMGAPPA